MKPVVAKIPVPTMLEITRAVALKNPICRSKPGRGTGVIVDGIRKAWIHSMMRRASGAGILGCGRRGPSLRCFGNFTGGTGAGCVRKRAGFFRSQEHTPEL